jgi:hypothetical protein
MIRFILNFILFGILFFLIYIYFPEAFAKMYGWVNDGYLYVKAALESTFGSHSPDNHPHSH